MDEAYLVHGISDILNAFFDQHKFEIRKNYIHPSLSAGKPGRKPELDYVVIDRSSMKMVMAIEAKWAGSSHCAPENILWDLVRLKLLKETNPECIGSFLIAGQKKKFDKCFSHEFFAPGTQHPLQQGIPRKKVFSLEGNIDHQSFIEKQKNSWKNKYPGLMIPSNFTSLLEDPAKSASSVNRFLSKTWIIS